MALRSWADQLSESYSVLNDLRAVLELTFEPAVSLISDALAAGKTIMTCGNGGSAAQAAHFAAELSVRYKVDRRGLAAISLADPVALTACANDYGFGFVFARQVEAVGSPGDVLVALSTSGKSANVNEAVARAKHLGLATLGLSGNRGISAGCDVDIVVPSRDTARIQEAHQVVIHLLCEELDNRIPKGEDPKWQTK